MDKKLFDNIKKYTSVIDVQKSVDDLKQDINDNFLNKVDKKFKQILINQSSFGTLIGHMSDALLPICLTNNNSQGLKFDKGNDTCDTDCICLFDPFYNTEGKTTCNKNQRINGAKTNAGKGKGSKYKTDEFHFYIFTAFNKPKTVDDDLTIANIWVGMLKPSDWSISENDGSGSAWIKNDIFDKRFINIKKLLKTI